MNSFSFENTELDMDVDKPGWKKQNETQYIITDKKAVVQDVTVLNQVSTGSDHRMVRASVSINLG